MKYWIILTGFITVLLVSGCTQPDRLDVEIVSTEYGFGIPHPRGEASFVYNRCGSSVGYHYVYLKLENNGRAPVSSNPKTNDLQVCSETFEIAGDIYCPEGLAPTMLENYEPSGLEYYLCNDIYIDNETFDIHFVMYQKDGDGYQQGNPNAFCGETIKIYLIGRHYEEAVKRPGQLDAPKGQWSNHYIIDEHSLSISC